MYAESDHNDIQMIGFWGRTGGGGRNTMQED